MMDKKVLALAKAYADKQRLAYAESKVLMNAGLVRQEGMMMHNADGRIGMETGKPYTVTTDSGTYESVCKEVEGGVYFVGNGAMLGLGEDTGETFLVAEFYENGWVYVGIDFNGGTHIKVEDVSFVKTIDPRFIPGVVLSAVELSVAPNGGEAFSEEDQLNLNAVADKGMPVILKWAMDTRTFAFVFHYMVDNGIPAYITNLGSDVIMIMKMDGKWSGSAPQTTSLI